MDVSESNRRREPSPHPPSGFPQPDSQATVGENHPIPSSSSTTASSSNTTTVLFSFLIIIAICTCIYTVNSNQTGLTCPECNCGDTETSGGIPQRSGVSETTLGLGLSVLVITVVTCVLASHLMSQNQFSALPDCIAYVLIGMFVGAIIRIAGASAAAGYALPNQEQLFLFILPPIIFEAGYSLNKQDFFTQWISILSFAVIGTLISAVCFGVGLYLLGFVAGSYRFSLWDALKFGSLISAVDPVATISVFNALKVNKTLHFLVFGESVLNDAVAIVLYQTFSEFSHAESFNSFTPVLNFFKMFFGSAFIGFLIACLTALILKYAKLSVSPTLELSFYVLMGYLPYFICEGLGMSGIMGILASGTTLAHYAYFNLSRSSQMASHQSFRMMSYIGETFLFVYLGAALTTFRHRWHMMTVLWGIILTLLSRAANIYPLSLVLNQYREQKISYKNQFIMWFSGLRGAIAFALSLNFSSIQEETRKVVVSTTLAIVLFTVIVLGGGTMPVLRLLRVEGANESSVSSGSSRGQENGIRDRMKGPRIVNEIVNGGGESDVEQQEGSVLQQNNSLLMQIESEWLRPALIVPERRAAAQEFDSETVLENNTNSIHQSHQEMIQLNENPLQ